MDSLIFFNTVASIKEATNEQVDNGLRARSQPSTDLLKTSLEFESMIGKHTRDSCHQQ